MPWRMKLYPHLPPLLRGALERLTAKEAGDLLEIRAHIGYPCLWVFSGKDMVVGPSLGRNEMDELLSALSGYSLYACERQMAQGYIPLPGGHRAGVCGRAAQEDGNFTRMSSITSICIRIAREVPGASREIRRYLLDEGRARRVLLLGPPGCGKTTVLRDAARFLSKDAGLRVAIADEREELFAGESADARLDVLAGAQKADAMRMLVRSMAPQVLLTDEIGRTEDAQALIDAASSGVGLLASAHAAGFEDVLRRPALRALYDARAFERYILLGWPGVCAGVWDEKGKRIGEDGYDELGCGGDGDDRNQRHGIFAGGWGKAPRAMDSGDAPLSFTPARCHSL